MAARGDRRGPEPAIVDGPQDLLNRQSERTRGVAGADEVGCVWRQRPDPLFHETVVTAGRGVIRVKPSLAHGTNHSGLADSKQPRRLAGADQAGVASEVGTDRARQRVDGLRSKATMTTAGGRRRLKSPPRNGTKDGRLTNAQAISCFPRTDQTVQDACLANA